MIVLSISACKGSWQLRIDEQSSGCSACNITKKYLVCSLWYSKSTPKIDKGASYVQQTTNNLVPLGRTTKKKIQRLQWYVCCTLMSEPWTKRIKLRLLLYKVYRAYKESNIHTETKKALLDAVVISIPTQRHHVLLCFQVSIVWAYFGLVSLVQIWYLEAALLVICKGDVSVWNQRKIRQQIMGLVSATRLLFKGWLLDRFISQMLKEVEKNAYVASYRIIPTWYMWYNHPTCAYMAYYQVRYTW